VPENRPEARWPKHGSMSAVMEHGRLVKKWVTVSNSPSFLKKRWPVSGKQEQKQGGSCIAMTLLKKADVDDQAFA